MKQQCHFAAISEFDRFRRHSGDGRTFCWLDPRARITQTGLFDSGLFDALLMLPNRCEKELSKLIERLVGSRLIVFEVIA
jgi:hypothetical protein